MIFAVIAIALGILIGMFAPIPIQSAMSMYYAVGILTALDSVIGALRSYMQNNYDFAIFVSGFVINALIAVILAYVGDRLGLPLYYAAIFVFGTRLFSNVSIMRRIAIEEYRKSKKENTKKTG